MAISKMADFMMMATCSLGFISLCKLVMDVVWWLWFMFLRPSKNLKHYGSWAIVTGCTDGIGKALTFELAKTRGRRSERHPDVEAKVVEIDLGSIHGEEIVTGMVVNNAGTAGSGEPRFCHDGELEKMEKMIKVNMEGLTWMTKAVIPEMLKKKKGGIVNIGSGLTFAFPSYPLNAVYAATKEYVRMSRSISLNYQETEMDILGQAFFPIKY